MSPENANKVKTRTNKQGIAKYDKIVLKTNVKDINNYLHIAKLF